MSDQIAQSREEQATAARNAPPAPPSLPPFGQQFHSPGLFATFHTGNLRSNYTGPVPEGPAPEDLALALLNTALLFYGIASLSRNAVK